MADKYFQGWHDTIHEDRITRWEREYDAKEKTEEEQKKKAGTSHTVWRSTTTCSTAPAAQTKPVNSEVREVAQTKLPDASTVNRTLVKKKKNIPAYLIPRKRGTGKKNYIFH